MAIAFQSATNAGVTTTNSTSLAINKPTSTASGDLLVTAMACYLGQTVTTLSGWTLVATVDGSSGVTTKLYYRVADGSEGSTFTWSFTLTGGNSLVAMTCLRFTGTDSTPLGVSFTASGGSVSTKTPATLTGAASTSVGIIACGVRPDLAGDPVLSTPSTSNWVANANAKRNCVTTSDFDSAIGVSYNLSTASSAPPACTTTANCEFGIVSAEFQVLSAVSASAGQPAVTVASQSAVMAVGANAEHPAVTAAAQDSTVSVSVNAVQAAVAAAAQDATVSTSVNAEQPAVVAVAPDATVSLATIANAEACAVSCSAFDATVSVGASAGAPAVTAVADSTATIVTLADSDDIAATSDTPIVDLSDPMASAGQFADSADPPDATLSNSDTGAAVESGSVDVITIVPLSDTDTGTSAEGDGQTALEDADIVRVVSRF